MLPVVIKGRPGSRRIVLNGVRLLIFLPLASILIWVIGATAIFYYIRESVGFYTVKYSTVLILPFKMEEYRAAKGRFWIEKAIELSKEAKWREAFELLRAGLQLVPSDLEARSALARVYVVMDRPDLAKKTFLEGLPYSEYKFGYVKDVIRFLFSRQDDHDVIVVADAILASDDPSAEVVRSVSLARAVALFNLNRFPDLVDWVQTPGMRSEPMVQLLIAKMAWEKGNAEEGLQMLRALNDSHATFEEGYKTLISYLRELGRISEIRGLCVNQQIRQPNNPLPYIDLIGVLYESAEVKQCEVAEGEFLRRFWDNPAALVQLGEYASRVGRVELGLQVLARCRELSLHVIPAMFGVLFADLHLGLYLDVLHKVEAYSSEKLMWTDSHRSAFLFIKCVAFSGLGRKEDFAVAIDALLKAPSLSASVALLCVPYLEKLGEHEAKVRILRRVVELDPNSQQATTELVRAEIGHRDISEFRTLIERISLYPKPPADLLARIKAQVESDCYLYLINRGELIRSLAKASVGN